MANVGIHLHLNYAGALTDPNLEAIKTTTSDNYREIVQKFVAFLERLGAGEGAVTSFQLSFSPTAPVNASATITISTGPPTAGDTVTIGGTALAAVADNTASPTTAQWRIGTGAGNTASAATNICQCINNNPTVRSKVYATVSGSVVTVYAKDPGQAGNAITLTKSGTNIAVSGGGTLTSGAGNDGAPYWVANGASTVSTKGGPSGAATGFDFSPTTGVGLTTFTSS